LRVVYANGNSPEVVSPRFFCGYHSAQVTVTADAEVFSPNGDGKKDLITFYQETSLEDSWTGKIRNESGSVVREFSWVEKADPSLGGTAGVRMGSSSLTGTTPTHSRL
jgi:hypothetical protein